MKKEYIITNEELTEKSLNLEDYVNDISQVDTLINMSVDLATTRILNLNDELKGEEDIDEYLDNNPKKVSAFKKLQFRVIYNLLFNGNNDPLDKSVDDIISGDLRLVKLNGFQKRVY